jgi:hypothetical protein
VEEFAAAFLGALVGGAGAVTATLLELRQARRDRANVRRENAAVLLGRVLSLVRELKPSPEGELEAGYDDVKWRWGELRLSLDVLGAGYPSTNVGERKDELLPAVEKTLESLKGLPASVDDAVADQARANELAHAMLETIRRS